MEVGVVSAGGAVFVLFLLWAGLGLRSTLGHCFLVRCVERELVP